MSEKETILSIRDLAISFTTTSGDLKALRGVNLEVGKGETVAIVGESGSGKSVTMKAAMGILPSNSRVDGGTIEFTYRDDNGEKVTRDLLKLSKKEMRRTINGKRIAMVFQDPMTSLNPTMSIGSQIMEGMIWHYRTPRRQAWMKAVELLKMVGITDAEKRMKQYPHQLSGGMRQRVVIATALACNPQLLICDEPTTALDVTIQAQILELIGQMKEQSSMSVILITHDLGVISSLCSRVLVMYGGLIMESGSLEDIFYRTGHPYTAGLLASIPKKTREKLVPIYGTPPDLLNPPAGCPFAARCPYAMELCRQYCPNLAQIGPGHESACWLHNRSVKESRGEVKLG